MRHFVKMLVPDHQPGGRWTWSWIVDGMLDAAAGLLVAIDGALANNIAIRDFQVREEIRPGDFVEFAASLDYCTEDQRAISVVARKLVSALPELGPMAARIVHHPVVVARGTVAETAPNVPTKGQGAPEPLVISVAPTSHTLSKADSEYLPTTPEEIAAEVARCAVDGASVVHLHAWSPDGRPSHDPEHVAETIRLIRAACDVVICVSTEGDASDDIATRAAVVGVQGVEMVSLVTGSTNYEDHIVFNSKPIMEHIAHMVRQFDLALSVEVLDLGFMENAKGLARKGLLTLPTNFTLTLGLKGAMGARKSTLEFLVGEVPRGSTWTVSAMGRHQLDMADIAVGMGGHVRVGMENSLFLEPGVRATGNAQFVAAVAEMARRRGRPVASPADARKILGVGGSK